MKIGITNKAAKEYVADDYKDPHLVEIGDGIGRALLMVHKYRHYEERKCTVVGHLKAGASDIGYTTKLSSFGSGFVLFTGTITLSN